MTDNVLTGTGAIDYISGTLHSFGNNGNVRQQRGLRLEHLAEQ